MKWDSIFPLFNEYGEKCQLNQRKMSNYQIFCVLANFLSKSGNSGHSAGLLTYLAVALCTGYLPLCNAAASRRRRRRLLRRAGATFLLRHLRSFVSSFRISSVFEETSQLTQKTALPSFFLAL